MSDTRLYDLMHLLVEYSLEVKPGQFALVQGSDIYLPYFKAAYAALLAAGANIQCNIVLEDNVVELLRHGSDQQISFVQPIPVEIFKRIDCMLSFFGNRNPRYLSNLPTERVKQYTLAQRDWRRLYNDRSDTGALRWVGWMPPSDGMAQEAGMSQSEFADFLYNACLVGKGRNPVEEWKKVAAKQDRIISYLDKKSLIRMSGEGTDVTFKTIGRNWVNCCGTRNMPDGEVFTCPVDDSGNGVMTFKYPAVYNGREAEGVRLVFKDGKVTEATADKGQDFLLSMIALDEGASRCGELAIGTNYNIDHFSHNILFDEKIGGTIHMALGNAMAYAGGVNHSVLHWDMIADMTGGEISADGEVFYRNGKFLID